MSESKIKNENVFHVSGWMVNELKLSGNSLMVFAIIFGFSQDGESYFTGSRKYLCDFTGASKPTIDKALNELIEKNYIYKYSEKRNDIIYNKYQVNLEILNFTTSKETLPPCKETLPNNIENNIDNKEISIINNTKEMEIFEHWNKKNIIIHRDFKKLEKKIKDALKEYDLETIKSAIDHYSEVINNQEYFYKYKWTLEQFLSRGKGLVEFTDKGSKWLNYLDFKNKNKPKEISRETAYPEFDDVGYIR